MVIDPSRTWATNSLIRLLPRSRVLVSVNRPCSTIWSRRLVCSTATGPAAAFSSTRGLAIVFLLLADLGLQLVQLLRLAHCIQQGFIQLFVGLQGALQIVQAGPEVQQFL